MVWQSVSLAVPYHSGLRPAQVSPPKQPSKTGEPFKPVRSDSLKKEVGTGFEAEVKPYFSIQEAFASIVYARLKVVLERHVIFASREGLM